MNANERNKLIWNAIPTLFDVSTPPQLVTPKRPAPQKWKLLIPKSKLNKSDKSIKSMDSHSLLPSHKIKLEPACETDQVHSSTKETTTEVQDSDMIDSNLSVTFKIEPPEVDGEYPGQGHRQASHSSEMKIKEEPSWETDHVHSSAKEVQDSDMIDSNLSVTFKIEPPEVDGEYPGQETPTCSQNVPSPFMQEDSEKDKIVCSNMGLNSMKQEVSNVVSEDKNNKFGKMVGMADCSSDHEMAGHNNTTKREHGNCNTISENVSSLLEINARLFLADKNCQLQNNVGIKTGVKVHVSDVSKPTVSVDSHQNRQMRKYADEKMHTCEDCGASFTRPSHLNTHKRAHTGERPYKCEDCGASFTQASSLNKHKRTHTGEKPYKCDECGASFGEAGNLKKHKRKHTGERPYICDDCGASYTEASSLIAHKRKHTGEKPYSCDDCGACFAQASHLKTHKRKHTGEKPYKCDECGTCFAQTSTLMRHKRTHTGERSYKCDDSGASLENTGSPPGEAIEVIQAPDSNP